MTVKIVDISTGPGKNCQIYNLDEGSIQRRVTVHDYETEALEGYFRSRASEIKKIDSVSEPVFSTETKRAPLLRTRQPFGIPGIE